MSGKPFALPAEVTMAQGASVLRGIEAALASADGGTLCLDGSELVEVDSAAIALLLHVRRLAQAKGVTLALHAMPRKLTDLAALYGVDELLSTASPSNAAAAVSST